MSVLRYRWAVLFASFYALMAFGFILQSIPPLMSPLMKEFAASHATAGLLMSAFVIPGVALTLPAGVLVDRHGAKLTGLMALSLISLGCLVTAVAPSFASALLGRFVSGVGGAIVLPASSAVIPRWFPPRELGGAMGIYDMAIPLSTVLAFPTISALMLAYGWRFPLYVSAAFGATALVLYPMIVRDAHAESKEVVIHAPVRSALRNIEVWKIGIVWLLFTAADMGFITWGPKLFEDFRGMGPLEASFLVSVRMLVGVPVTPLYGWLSDRLGRRRMFIAVGFASMALALMAIGLTTGAALVAFIIVLGLAGQMMTPASFALVGEVLEPSQLGTGYGLVSMCVNVGLAVSPLAIGYVLDMTSSYPLAFLGFALFAAAGLVVALTLKTR